MNELEILSKPISPIPPNGSDPQDFITARTINGELYLAYPESANQKPTLSISSDGVKFRQEILNHVVTGTPRAVDVVSFQEKLFVIYMSAGSIPYLTYKQGEHWSETIQMFPDLHRTVSRASSVVEFKGKLYATTLVLENGNLAPYISASSDGITWPKTPTTRLFGSWTTKHAMSLAVFQDHLYASFIGDRYNEVYVARSSDGSTWPNEPTRIFSPWVATQYLPLTVSPSGERLYAGFVGRHDDMHIASTDGEIWTMPYPILTSYKTNRGLGLTSFGRNLMVCFRDREKDQEPLLAKDAL